MHRAATIGFCVFVCTAITGNAYPQPDLEAQSTALKLITETADKICNIVRTEGNSESEQVSGDVKAQLNGLIGKLVDVGISGAGSHNADHYAGLIREDLPKALLNNADCKLKVFEKLQDKMIIRAVHRNSNCRSIAGTWYHSTLKAVIPIMQDGCKISSAFTVTISVGALNSEIYYEMKGSGDGNKFEFAVNRTDPSGCTVIFYGRLTAIEEQQMISHIDRSSGQCGVAENFTESVTLVRR